MRYDLSGKKEFLAVTKVWLSKHRLDLVCKLFYSLCRQFCKTVPHRHSYIFIWCMLCTVTVCTIRCFVLSCRAPFKYLTKYTVYINKFSLIFTILSAVTILCHSYWFLNGLTMSSFKMFCVQKKSSFANEYHFIAYICHLF